MRLKDRLAIVTGGSSGIGRAIAIALSNEGAYVVVSDIDQAPKRGKYHEKNTTTSTVDEISKIKKIVNILTWIIHLKLTR